MTEPAPPPHPSPSPSYRGLCGACNLRFTLSSDPTHRKTNPKRLPGRPDDPITCFECPNTFHKRCMVNPPMRLPFVCAECRFRKEMVGLVTVVPDEAEETKSDHDKDVQEEREEPDGEFVLEEIDEESTEDERDAGCTARPAPAAAHETHVGANVKLSATRKRSTSAGRKSQSKRPSVAAARQPAIDTTGGDGNSRQASTQQAAKTGEDWSDAETILLIKAVSILAVPSPAQVEKVYNALAKKENIRPRSAAVLAEMAQQKDLGLATTSPPPADIPPAAHPRRGPMSRPRWTSQEDAIVRKFIDRVTEAPETLYKEFQEEIAKQKLVSRGRTLDHFKRRLYKLRLEAAKKLSE